MQKGWGEPDDEDLPADEPTEEESDVEIGGKGKGKAAVVPPEGSEAKAEKDSLAKLKAWDLERKEMHRQIDIERKERHRQIDIEIDEREKELQERLNRLFQAC